MTDLTTTEGRNDEIAVLIDEARSLLERLDDFALRTHLISGPLNEEIEVEDARWPGLADKISYEFNQEHPRYEELFALCWEMESRALAALSIRSEYTFTDWLADWRHGVDDIILADPMAKDDRKARIRAAREFAERHP